MAELRVKSTGTLKLFESDNTSSVTIASPASLSADRTVTLPDADVTLVSGTIVNTPSLKAVRGSAQTIADETSTVILFDTEIYDTDSAYATGTGIFTVPSGKGGKYWFGVTAGYSTSADISDVNFWLSKNDQTAISATAGLAIGIDVHHNGTETTNQAQQVSGCFSLAAGDTMRVYTWHNYGSNRDTAQGGRMTFSGFRISS